MNVNLPQFCSLLRDVREDAYLDADGLSPYLMDNLFYPYMQGKDIRLDDLDYDAFALEDLDRLFEYIGDLDTVYGALESKMKKLMKSSPAARPVRAFC